MIRLSMRAAVAVAILAVGAVSVMSAMAHGQAGEGPGYGQGTYGPCPYQGMMGPETGKMNPGAGPGPGMMGHGAGVMGHGAGVMGHGAGMMGHGYGHRPGKMGPGMMSPEMGAHGYLDRDLSAADVKEILEHRLFHQGNKRLRVGKVEVRDEDTVLAEIETVDGSLVERLEANRHTGWIYSTEQ